MFVEDNSSAVIAIKYKKNGYHYKSYSDRDFQNLDIPEEEKAKYKSLTVTMKELSWGLYNDLQEGAVDIDSEGTRRFNYKKYKESRLARLIISWDATTTNKEGKVVPVLVNEKTIKSLAPEIAESILNAYDDVMFLSEEEEGK